MARVEDVAAYILKKLGPITAMKLQKLVYYCQAWCLVWEEAPLFDDEIQAWANGPVSPKLYRRHRGGFKLVDIDGDASALSDRETGVIDDVLEFYGDKSSQWLSELTHKEEPWKRAREKAGLKIGERGSAVISHAAMANYYSSLL